MINMKIAKNKIFISYIKALTLYLEKEEESMGYLLNTNSDMTIKINNERKRIDVIYTNRFLNYRAYASMSINNLNILKQRKILPYTVLGYLLFLDTKDRIGVIEDIDNKLREEDI